MSIDIHKLINGRADTHLLSINDSEYSELLPAFERYQSKTGCCIDQYGDLKLSSGVQPLIDSIEAVGVEAKIYDTLLKVLKQSEVSDYGIIFVGD